MPGKKNGNTSTEASRTIDRQWLLLRRVPRYPRSVSTPELQEYLRGQGHEVTPRTTQRDMEDLCVRFSISCDEQERPYRWYWPKDAMVVDLPGMDAATALAFVLVEAHLKPLVPAVTVQALRGHFQRAHEVLDADEIMSNWTRHVRVLSRGPMLQPPHVDADVMAAVSTALLKGRQLEVVYAKRGSRKHTTYRVQPLGLVMVDKMLNLVCTLWDYTNTMQLLLHRMVSATVLDEKRKVPRGFDLDTYVADGHIGFSRNNEKAQLVARFSADAAVTVTETPLDPAQKLRELPDGGVELTARVADNMYMRGWLFGFGDAVEIIKPAALRREFHERANAMARKHA